MLIELRDKSQDEAVILHLKALGLQMFQSKEIELEKAIGGSSNNGCFEAKIDGRIRVFLKMFNPKLSSFLILNEYVGLVKFAQIGFDTAKPLGFIFDREKSCFEIIYEFIEPPFFLTNEPNKEMLLYRYKAFQIERESYGSLEKQFALYKGEKELSYIESIREHTNYYFIKELFQSFYANEMERIKAKESELISTLQPLKLFSLIHGDLSVKHMFSRDFQSNKLGLIDFETVKFADKDLEESLWYVNNNNWRGYENLLIEIESFSEYMKYHIFVNALIKNFISSNRSFLLQQAP